MPKTPPPKGVRSMSSLAAELAGQDREQVPEFTQKGLRLVFISFSNIRQFVGHPFRLYTEERLSDMVESIRQNGILMPLIIHGICKRFSKTGLKYYNNRRKQYKTRQFRTMTVQMPDMAF